jgi:hypothetical protein
MCDPKPGARCSADTAKELRDARRRLAGAQADLARQPGDASARRRLQQAEEKLTAKSDAYDSSPQGQRDLVDAIAVSVDPDAADVDALRTRLYAGRATRISQKRALARSKGEAVDVEILEASKALNRLRHPDGGFTRHADTGREETLGFFVSPYPDREQAIRAEDLRPIHLLRYAKSNADLFAKDGHYMGAWHDPETGVVSLDVSVKTTSAEQARSLAEQHQQVAFYDAQMGSSVEVSTTARDRIAGLNEGNER